ncbi:hypothetical protein K435DRAFT_966271 [Dendrothele bispora CBS 962.96]|uniref:RBR-type E3 ubiquitin transferase n=1 Tax=Dendrothele bispora (strain CBS 962.96) TaxID=1314807 RepID=A0A4V4HFN9_DENBC|nr:hypothetical protein K435DRAFT_966271 [Dendrothele bispora CBS 962.96]
MSNHQPVHSSGSTKDHSGNICSFFQSGRCRYGDNCRNSHATVPAQTNQGSIPKVPIVSSDPGNRSSMDKIVCSYWIRGGCTRGETCRYWHDPAFNPQSLESSVIQTSYLAMTTSSPSQISHSSNRRVPCSYWVRGSCTRGDTCNYWHDLGVNFDADTAKQEHSNQFHSNTPSASKCLNQSGFKATIPCMYWEPRGTCAFGDTCSYRHDPNLARTVKLGTSKESGQLDDSSASRAISLSSGESSLTEKVPCMFWNEGLCSRGDACKFWHDTVRHQPVDHGRDVHTSNTTTTSIQSGTLPNDRILCSYWSRGTCARNEDCKYWHDPEVKNALHRKEVARREEKTRFEAVKTVQHLVSGTTLVKFGPGVRVERVVTGFESCRIKITGLPLDIKHPEVLDLVRSRCELDPEKMLHLVSLDLDTSTRCKDAVFIVEEDAATVGELKSGLDGSEIRGQILRVETAFSGFSGGMTDSKTGNWLVISWRMPFTCFVVKYTSPALAEGKIRNLNGMTIGGRKITVAPNRTRLGSVDPKGVFVSGIPLDVTQKEICRRFGSNAVTKIPTEEYDDHRVDSWVTGYIKETVGRELVEFDETQIDKLQGTRSIRARFRSWEDAKDVYDHMKDRKFDRIGKAAFGLWLSDPYQIAIPIRQYQAQKKLWDALSENKPLHVRIQGDKSRIWELEKLLVVFGIIGAYVDPDWKLKALKVYGEPRACIRAREMVGSELERLTKMMYTKVLKRQSIRFFLNRGVAILEEAFGESSVSLNIFDSPCRITIQGGEAALHLLNKLIAESLENITTDFTATTESVCPICLCEVSNPFKLGCGHEYCTTCLRHFFITDAKTFPLVCAGDDNDCKQPIALPMLQKILTHSQFYTLLEVAFSSYVEKNTQIYKYCKTPDCRQVYSCISSTTRTLRCPSCLATICPRCHEDGHDGLTCEERRKHTDTVEQERLTDQWAKEAGAKRCPQCKVWIQKTEGCNHMSCKCGAHICWVCMRVFSSGTIYSHMNETHGSIYDARDPLIQGEDIQAQLQALRLYDV